MSLLPFAGRLFDSVYLAAAGLFCACFMALGLRLRRRADRRSALRLYLFSLAYLAALFAAMVVDVRLT